MALCSTPVDLRIGTLTVAGALEELVGRLEPAWLSAREAGELVEVFSKMANLAELGRARCARRAATGLVHLQEGFRSPAAWLADKSGGSIGEAIAELSSAEAVEELPGLAEALGSGSLSLAKAAVIGEAARADRAAEADLLAAARVGDLRKLKARADERRAARESEAELGARHEALRARRYLRTWTARDGACRGEFSFAPADAAPLLARLEIERDRCFKAARERGERERYEAYAADALCALGRAPEDPTATAGKVHTTRVLLRVDLPALLRGERQGDEVCEIAGVGPVPLATARELLGDAVVDLVVRKGIEVRSVTSLGRTIPRAVRVALVDRDPTCVVPGCTATQRLEIDHWRVDFALGGPTELDNLCRLCTFHHRLKTHRGWRLIGGPGQWRFLGPG